MKTNKITVIKKYPQTVSLDKYFEQRLGTDQYIETTREAYRQAEILIAMHKLITTSVDQYMKKEDIGFNELARRLKLSPTYVSKMRKGQANLTFGTFAQVMGILGKEASEFLKIKKS